MALIKSHSNYVLKSKHQLTSDGSVWERDMSTVGGVNQFRGGMPVYQSGNFVITVNGDNGHRHQLAKPSWTSNSSSGDVWTMQSISGMVSEDKTEDDTKIVLKKDYYDLRDFAYYGSLSELFRSSINDILTRFPGELYSYSADIRYTEHGVVNDERVTESKPLGSGKYLDNPFGIDLHSKSKPTDADAIKYFADGGYSNYCVIYSDGSSGNVTSWSASPVDKSCFNAGEKISTITLKIGTRTLTINAYLGDNDVVYYFTATNGVHIRPNQPFLDAFYNECNLFERIILNPDTEPKYKATFSVIRENEYGYYKELEDFIFPTLNGDYNLDVSSYGFNMYTNRLSEIGGYYDENFTDNLYRCMTHESIKNFDWTFTREYNPGDEEEYVRGGEKVQKVLRLFAREFDDIKSYIDEIKNFNKITYNERNNVPDYFLTDQLSLDGWDVKHTYPYQSGKTSDEYVQNPKNVVKPYMPTYADQYNSNGYFIGCCSSSTQSVKASTAFGTKYSTSTALYVTPSSGNTTLQDCNEKILERIRPYFDSKEVSYFDIDNSFLRRLKLNSRQIWRHKGTLDGVEMMLGMFGLKSKRFVKSNEKPDYEINEYVRSATTSLTDSFDASKGMFAIEWLNTKKLVSYGNAPYVPYQGIPVSYSGNSTTRELYPSFNADEPYDSGLYYQMKGGWLLKKRGNKYFQYDVNNNIVESTDCRMFKETVRDVRSVSDIDELLSIPATMVEDGSIYYVDNVDDNLIVADGKTYKVKKEYYSGNAISYVELVKDGGIISVGANTFLSESVTVNDKNGNRITVYLLDKPNGYMVKAYIKNGDPFLCEKRYGPNTANTQTVYYSNVPSGDGYTNYFILNDVNCTNTLTSSDGNGWCRLKETDQKYQMINTIDNYYEGNNPHNGKMQYDNGDAYFDEFKDIFRYHREKSLFDYRCDGVAESQYKETGFTISSPIVSNKVEDLVKKKSGYNPSQHERKLINSWLTMNSKNVKITFYMQSVNDKQELKYLDDIVMNYLTQMIPSTAILEIEYQQKR